MRNPIGDVRGSSKQRCQNTTRKTSGLRILHVVHKNMETAYFDTKNRELGLPILKNMSGDIYDLMTLHEVGHALWTDPEDWHKIVSADNDDDLPKSFINVTEDVRIERKIKDKYPGGRRLAFRRGL